jgi:hypothetical protein
VCWVSLCNEIAGPKEIWYEAVYSEETQN